jgi:MerR family transcriptional regulator, light-induced transcriptional regulator
LVKLPALADETPWNLQRLRAGSIAAYPLRVTERSAGADNSTSRRALRTAAQRSRLYLEALRAADTAGAFRVASDAISAGMSVPQLYQEVITPAMYEVGTLWERGVLTVADEHLATELSQRVLAALRPPLEDEAQAEETDAAGGRERVMLAAVQGEEHVLGLRMAADVLEDAGLEPIYLGADVPTDALLEAVASLSPDLLGLSVTMAELAPRLEEVAAAVRGSHPRLDLLLGGQAASPRIDGGTLVRDLEALPEMLAGRSQV